MIRRAGLNRNRVYNHLVGESQRSSRAGARTCTLMDSYSINASTITKRARVASSVALVAMAACTPTLDAATAQGYHWLCKQWWFRHDSFEPALSLTSFAVRNPRRTQKSHTDSVALYVQNLLIFLRT